MKFDLEFEGAIVEVSVDNNIVTISTGCDIIDEELLLNTIAALIQAQTETVH